MSTYVPPEEQLVTEIVVRDIRGSTSFYGSFGFELLRDGGDFVELAWENHRLFLAQLSAFHGIADVELPPPPKFPLANIRVMVPNVDDYWKLANEIGAPIIVPIADLAGPVLLVSGHRSGRLPAAFHHRRLHGFAVMIPRVICQLHP